MWDKDGLKQISPTGRQSPHSHDSLKHPSYFPERVWDLPVTQACIYLPPAWLRAKCLLPIMEQFGLERTPEVTWTNPWVFWNNRGLSTPQVIILTAGASCILDTEWKRNKGNIKDNTLRKNYNGKQNFKKYHFSTLLKSKSKKQQNQNTSSYPASWTAYCQLYHHVCMWPSSTPNISGSCPQQKLLFSCKEVTGFLKVWVPH